MAGAASQDDGGGEEFELNLAPIIDCFTVLITYMLVSASFISLDMLEVNVAATASEPPPQEQNTPPEIPTTLTIELKAQNALELKVNGKETASFNLAANTLGNWDLDRMQLQLDQIMAKWPAIKEVSVKAEPGIQYKHIVRVVETVKKKNPKVLLGE